MTDVLVTGASRGIGLGLVLEYLARGARVFAACRNAVPEPRAGLVPVRLDVTDPAQIDAVAREVATHTDRLDILVNNAGVHRPSTGVADVDPDGLVESMRVNAIGPVLVTRAFRPLLGNGSRIVNVTMPTRPVAQLSRTGDHAYVASRYALNALTRMSAVELGAAGIVTVALYPGHVQTDMSNHNPEAAPVPEVVPGLVSLIEALGEADNGECFLPDGTRFPW